MWEDEFQDELDSVKDKEDQFSEQFKVKEKVGTSDTNSLFFAFLNRSRFIYSLCDILTYVLRCLCFRDLSSLRRNNKYKKHYLFEKAEEKFNDELDIVRIVKSLHKFKMFAQAMLS